MRAVNACVQSTLALFWLTTHRGPTSNLEMAVSYCCAVQLQLLDLPWPEELLQWPECAAMTDSESGRWLFRGLRLRMGVTWGLADSRKPLNTGALLLPLLCCLAMCCSCLSSTTIAAVHKSMATVANLMQRHGDWCGLVLIRARPWLHVHAFTLQG